MAKRVETRMWGLDVIIRHDYEDHELQKKLEGYQAASAKSFMHFLTNVPNFKYNRFLDVGCGDDYVMNHPLVVDKFGGRESVNGAPFDLSRIQGIDLHVDQGQYDRVAVADWYEMAKNRKEIFGHSWNFDAVFINHSLEHAENPYALMQQVSALQAKGDALFVAVPDGNTPFGYSITSSTTHFSCITEGFLNTLLQRFGYNVAIERREFRPGAHEIWAYAIKQYNGFPLDV